MTYNVFGGTLNITGTQRQIEGCFWFLMLCLVHYLYIISISTFDCL